MHKTQLLYSKGNFCENYCILTMAGNQAHQNISPNLPEGLRRNMEHFQAKNNIPIHLKGGPLDRILFGSTVVLCGVGVVMLANFIYSMAKKKE
ncbi:hypothetical protein PVAND_004914 [Polypedilum vanderplanki]|uniref:Uncharacterized protein n=1 Tax=Polypedilum vanderplanki TaxID=319348 RepID=A0A9J6BZH7_POLVA|nr:hypothetical protein PVAND_004914 [Polypedilum vanderplanki]